jgi:hypothetical protein
MTGGRGLAHGRRFSRGPVGGWLPSSSSLHRLRRQFLCPAATIVTIVPCSGRPQISSCRPVPYSPLCRPCSCSPASADPGAGHRAASRALPRREVTSRRTGGRVPRPAPAGCEPQAVGARCSTIAGGPPCPSGRTGEGDGLQNSS